MDAVPKSDDDRGFEGADWLNGVNRVGIRRSFRGLQESCLVKRRKVRDTVAEVVELADELFEQVDESGTQVANDAALVTQLAIKTENLSLSPNFKKVREQAVIAKAEWDALLAEIELAPKHNVTLAKMREERLEEVEAWMAITWRSPANLAKVRDDASAEIRNLRSKHYSDAARHYALLASIRRVVKAR